MDKEDTDKEGYKKGAGMRPQFSALGRNTEGEPDRVTARLLPETQPREGSPVRPPVTEAQQLPGPGRCGSCL